MELQNFWQDSQYSKEEYEEPFLDDNIKKVETQLGHSLPASYLNFMKQHNGGILKKRHFIINESTSIELEGFFSLGKTATHSILGSFGSLFWINDWEYPSLGIYICDTSSGGHDMICLDYSKQNKEPEVVHIDQSENYKITILAKNFEEFILNLKNEEDNATPEGFIWHYMNDYDAETNSRSLQLVQKEAHMRAFHIDYEK